MRRIYCFVQRLTTTRVPRTVLIMGSAGAFLIGALTAYWYARQAAWLMAMLVPGLVLAWRRQTYVLLGLSMIACFLLGWQRGSAYMRQVARYDSLARHQVTIVARAADDAVYGARYQLTFSADAIQLVAPYRAELPGSMSIKGFGLPAVTRGDIVQVSGQLYRSRGNNFAGISFAQLQMVEASSSPWEALRRKFVGGMQTALPEPAASFGLGLLIGQRSTLPQQNADELRKVGLTHIIAVSGANLTILVEVCRRWLGKLSKFQNTAASLALIGAFLFVTGLSPPIVRAAVVSMMTLVAWYYGRAFKPLVLLSLVAACTVWANPSYIWGNVSWYLSFLAFFGVLVVGPLLTRRWFGGTKPPLLIAVTIESIAASLVTVPYILAIFGQTSTVALLANILVVPFIPFSMLASLIAGLGGMFMPVVAGWVAWPARLLLTYMLDMATLLSRVPHAFIEHIGFGPLAVAVSYASLLFICFVLWHWQRRSLKCAIITDKKCSTSE